MSTSRHQHYITVRATADQSWTYVREIYEPALRTSTWLHSAELDDANRVLTFQSGHGWGHSLAHVRIEPTEQNGSVVTVTWETFNVGYLGRAASDATVRKQLAEMARGLKAGVEAAITGTA